MATKPGVSIPTWPCTVEDKIEYSTAQKNTGWELEQVPDYRNFNFDQNARGLWTTYLEDVTDENVTDIGTNTTNIGTNTTNIGTNTDAITLLNSGLEDRYWTIDNVSDWISLTNELTAFKTAGMNRIDGTWTITITTDQLLLNSEEQNLDFYDYSGTGKIVVNGYTGGTGGVTRIHSSVSAAVFLFLRMNLAEGIEINDIYLEEEGAAQAALNVDKIGATPMLVTSSDFQVSDPSSVAVKIWSSTMVQLQGCRAESQNIDTSSGTIEINAGSDVRLNGVTDMSVVPGNGVYIGFGCKVWAGTNGNVDGSLFDWKINGGQLTRKAVSTWEQFYMSF